MVISALCVFVLFLLALRALCLPTDETNTLYYKQGLALNQSNDQVWRSLDLVQSYSLIIGYPFRRRSALQTLCGSLTAAGESS